MIHRYHNWTKEVIKESKLITDGYIDRDSVQSLLDTFTIYPGCRVTVSILDRHLGIIPERNVIIHEVNVNG